MLILIVEREEESYRTLSNLLRQCCQEEVSILYSDNGQNALEVLGNRQVDLLYTNVKMKDMTGFGLAKKALELQPELKVIFVEDTESYALEAIQTRVSDYIMKPVTLEQVKRTLMH